MTVPSVGTKTPIWSFWGGFRGRLKLDSPRGSCFVTGPCGVIPQPWQRGSGQGEAVAPWAWGCGLAVPPNVPVAAPCCWWQFCDNFPEPLFTVGGSQRSQEDPRRIPGLTGGSQEDPRNPRRISGVPG